MIVKTVRDREKGQDGKLKNEKNGWLGRAIRYLCIRWGSLLDWKYFIAPDWGSSFHFRNPEHSAR